MIEFLVRGIVVNGIGHHPWVLLAVVPVAWLWWAGRRAEARALKAKRQEAVVLFGRLRDRRADQQGSAGLH